MTTIKIGAKDVPVECGLGVEDAHFQKALESAPLTEWSESIASTTLDVRKVLIQGVDMFGPRVGFVKIKADCFVGEKMVPGIALLRGGAVGVLVIIECDDKKYSLLTRQARVPIGKGDYPEIPAGMLDGSGNFAGVAAKEMQEETGIQISQAHLIDLTELAYGNKFKGMIPSAGGCDEFIRLFAFRTTMPQKDLTELQGKLTGNLHEGEVITLQVCALEELWRLTSDAKTLGALFLYEKLAESGKIPGATHTTRKNVKKEGCTVM